MTAEPAGDRPTPTDPSDQASHQGILPGLLAAFQAPPPDRGLFRELLRQTVGRGAHTYIVNGQRIAAATIKVIAWTLYGRMDAAGMVVDAKGKPFSRQALADEASVSPRTLTTGIAFLDTARCTGRRRGSGRRRDVISINPGGLTWTAVCNRIKVATKAREGAAEGGSDPRSASLLLVARGEEVAPLRGRSGEEVAPLEGYVQRATGRRKDRRRPDRSPDHQFLGGAAAAPGTAREGQQQQQQPSRSTQDDERTSRRVEGLFAAIAARARELGLQYDEDRERALFAAGEIDVAALQRHADKLADKLTDRRYFRATGRRREVEPDVDADPADFEAAAPEVDPADDDPARARALALLRGEK